MQDPQPNPQPKPESNSSQPETQPGPGAGVTPITNFHIGEEFGTAKRTLPPVGIVLACIAAIVVVLAIYAFVARPKPQGSGSINFVAAAEAPGQNTTLVAITMTLANNTPRALWVKGLKARLTTADGKTFEDDAASAIDYDRYYQGFPALKESSEPPLTPETKLKPGTEQRGTIIVAFKVTKDLFDQRKALAVEIQPYDEPMPIILK